MTDSALHTVNHAGVLSLYLLPRQAPAAFMSNEAPAPTPEDKSKYDAIKKELLQALAKKRMVDKQLVSRSVVCARVPDASGLSRRN